MTSEIPTTMRAIALTKFCNPAEYNLGTLPVPKITRPDELLIRVRAASVNPVDVKLASSIGKMMGGANFPSKLGYDLAGEVVDVGTDVSTFKKGDEVYSRVGTEHKGTLAEYCLSSVSTTALKPASLSFAEAAAIPLAAQTALQALDVGEEQVKGGLKGKVVYVPAGLSGTGSFGVQLAKNVFGAKSVVTSLSPGKIKLIGELMGEGTPDVIVDYTKQKTVDVTGKGSVDFMFDTVGETVKSLGVIRKGGAIVSVSMGPNGTDFKKKNPTLPTYIAYILNVVDWLLRTYTGWYGVSYKALVLVGNAKDLERLSGWVQEGKVKPIVGSVVKLSDLEGVRKGCQQCLEGKGGVGKFVVEID
ncbi:GroES-like protein [Hyaloscypha variabilis]|uniref:GroES-like protein n=1 Tax=Hyaloscypha variabilis (strain UAMH 11265 / GT02V1 / F) TaxID=1149755 RepID=A0A2J6RNL3_HYAVF|nr:GroES-like protein [Hyaloscypha variabilis F]